MHLAAGDCHARLDLTAQRKPLFIIHGLIRQRGVFYQRAQIHTRKRLPHRAVVRPRQFQQSRDQRAHPVRHQQNIRRKARFFLRPAVLCLQKLGVRENHAERCFQLVRRIGHKLPLLLPRLFYRLHCPARQQKADEQEAGKAQHADEHAVAPEIAHGGKLTGNIGI